MEKIRFLKSVHGSYGEANPGDEKEVTKTLAHELVTSGIAEKVDGEIQSAEAEQTGNARGESSEPKPITSEPAASEAEADASAKTDEPEQADEVVDQNDTADDADTPAERRARRRRAD